MLDLMMSVGLPEASLLWKTVQPLLFVQFAAIADMTALVSTPDFRSTTVEPGQYDCPDFPRHGKMTFEVRVW